jgi:hypothetical protein
MKKGGEIGFADSEVYGYRRLGKEKTDNWQSCRNMHPLQNKNPYRAKTPSDRKQG